MVYNSPMRALTGVHDGSHLPGGLHMNIYTMALWCRGGAYVLSRTIMWGLLQPLTKYKTYALKLRKNKLREK